MGRKPDEGISEKQYAVYEYIVRHLEEFGYQPTTTEIAEADGTSPRSVVEKVDHLCRKGLLTPPVKPRAERAWGLPGIKVVLIPVDDDGDPVETVREVKGYRVTVEKVR